MQRFTNKLLLLILTFVSVGHMAHAQQQAGVQVIHNSPDTDLKTVDVYINGGKPAQLDDIAFRDASSIIPVPDSTNLNIDIAPANSTSATEAVASFQYTFPAGSHAIMVSGVMDSSKYASNPNGFNINLALDTSLNIRTSSAEGTNYFDLSVYHGATDAPYIDLLADRQSILVDNLPYGKFNDYLSLPLSQYLLDVTDSTGGADRTYLHTAFAPLNQQFGGQAGIAFASGFLDSIVNNNGRKFDLIVALPDGTTFQLPAIDFSLHQIVHSSADPAADTVDVYVNGQLNIDNFQFRKGTPYLQLPFANETFEIGIAPYNSNTSGAGYADTLVTFDRRPRALNSYIHNAIGLIQPGKFASNPQGNNIGFDLYTHLSSRIVGDQNQGTITMGVVNCVTDFPILDLVFTPNFLAPNFEELDNLEYGFRTPFFQGIKPEAYTATVYDSSQTTSQNPDTFYNFKRDISEYADTAMYITLSGFFTPDDNMDGAEVQMIGYLPSGDTVMFNKAFDHNNVDTGDNSDGILEAYKADFGAKVFPNPVEQNTQISYELEQAERVSYTLYDNAGKVVKQRTLGNQKAGSHDENLTVENLESGLYHLELQVGNKAQNVKLLVD